MTIRLGAALLVALLNASCAGAGKSNAQNDAADRAAANEALKAELARQISNIGACMTKQAQNPSLNRVDTETAAHAVVARCTDAMEEHRRYVSTGFPGNPIQFQEWWRKREADDLDFARKAIALVRTQ